MIGSFPISCGSHGELDQMWLEFIESSLGSFLSKEPATWNKAESIVVSRLLAGLQKLSESLETETLPTTSVDLLRQWADRLGVPVAATDTPQTLRSACEAKFSLSEGPNRINIDSTLSKLLSDSLVEIRYYYGSDLANPPIETWDAQCNPDGYVADVLSADYQITERAHLLVVVKQPSNLSEVQFFYLLNTKLRDLLNTLLPAWATWDWSLLEPGETEHTGFIIGVSRIGYVAL